MPAAFCTIWKVPASCASAPFSPQWQGIRRPPVLFAQTRRHLGARVRPVLRRPWDRTPSGPAAAPSNQLDGRTLQRPDQGGAAITQFPFRRGTGNHAAPLSDALQSAASTISLGKQDTLACHETMAQNEVGLVQETAISPSGMRHLHKPRLKIKVLAYLLSAKKPNQDHSLLCAPSQAGALPLCLQPQKNTRLLVSAVYLTGTKPVSL